jgi:hypothetical protein
MPIFRRIEEGQADKNYNWPEMDDFENFCKFSIFTDYFLSDLWPSKEAVRDTLNFCFFYGCVIGVY